MPQVSVVLPVRNAAATIDEALRSVFAQSLERLECIVVDDGSTDGTTERLADWNDPRLRVIRQSQKGLVPALRRGVDAAQAPYVARLDADDAWDDPTKLAQQVDYLDRHPECAVVGTWYRVVRPDGTSTLVQPPEEDRELRRLLLREATLAHPTVVFRRSVYDTVGGYRSRFDLAEDFDLWFRMGRRGTFHVVPVVGLRYAAGHGGRSESQARRQALQALAVVCVNLPHVRAYPTLASTLTTLLRRLAAPALARLRPTGQAMIP